MIYAKGKSVLFSKLTSLLVGIDALAEAEGWECPVELVSTVLSCSFSRESEDELDYDGKAGLSFASNEIVPLERIVLSGFELTTNVKNGLEALGADVGNCIWIKEEEEQGLEDDEKDWEDESSDES
ncbi:hypothetical protein GYMLUDRAFT_39282 [Collybiopsis luxurians FD-317 M1]|nr:hypothetical protein GYMLUDRAFT_39282 [Collybiopsis luxurians FD-317 M1]